MKKGFTLIELLAVIVILAIIALIATPIILGIINDAKEDSNKRSVENYAHAVELAVARYAAGHDGVIPSGEYTISSESKGKEIIYSLDTSIKIEIDYKGEAITEGKIKVETDGKIEIMGMSFDKGKTLYNYSEEAGVTSGGDVSADDEGNATVLTAGLYDAEGILIASWDQLVNNYNIDIDKDYTNEVENGLYESIPGMILSTNENLNKGVKLVIDSSVTKIGVGALGAARNLIEVIIPNSVTSIEQSSFASCTNLINIVIPNSVTSIGEGAFYYCESLTEVTMENGVTSIGDGTFSGCTSLKTINYTGTSEQWDAISKGNNWNYGIPNDYKVNYNYLVE